MYGALILIKLLFPFLNRVTVLYAPRAVVDKDGRSQQYVMTHDNRRGLLFYGLFRILTHRHLSVFKLCNVARSFQLFLRVHVNNFYLIYRLVSFMRSKVRK